MKKGLLIVIDGPDSVGKSTQVKLLEKRLKKLGFGVVISDFPRYGEPSAWGVEQYLQGNFGSAKELGPKIPSILFALDRYVASKEIHTALSKGKIVLSNRYVTANMSHQGCGIKQKSDRHKFFKWVHELEYTIFRLPKPDLQIILSMPVKFSLQLMKGRIGKNKDILEKDIKHLISSRKVYQEISKKFKYTIIESIKNNTLLSPEEINEKIWQAMKLKLKV